MTAHLDPQAVPALASLPLPPRERVRRLVWKSLATLGFVALSALLVLAIVKLLAAADPATLGRLAGLLPVLLLCGAGYALAKGAALAAALRASRVDEAAGVLPATALFCESVAIGIASFPGGLNADLYKVARLRRHGKKRVAKALLRWRAGIWLSVASVVLLALAERPDGFTLLQLALGVGGTALLAATLLRPLPAVAAVLFAFAAVGTDALAATLLLTHLVGAGAPDLLLTHMSSHVLGASTGVPLGLGAFDLSYGWRLHGALGAGGLAAFLALYRLTGPCLTALVGWALVARRTGSLLLAAPAAAPGRVPSGSAPSSAVSKQPSSESASLTVE